MNMENKLTEQEITRIFNTYCPCLTQVTNDHYVDGGYIGTLQGMQYENPLVEHNKGGDGYEQLSDCKLLLTPLSKITDEHAIEVTKICGYNIHLVEEDRGFNDITNEVDVYIESADRQPTHIIIPFSHICFEGYITICFNGEIFTTDDNDKQEYVSALNFAHQYLIQKGYAVPLFFGINHWANGKTAIELGLAFDKTKI